MHTPSASIVVASRNRAELLERAVQSCVAQAGVKFEVLVYDDASTDQTSPIIRERFPEVRLFTNTTRQGYIRSRNRGFHDALAPYVISIDDDALFTSEFTVRDAITTFTDDPTIAAVALPYVEPLGRTDSTMARVPSPGTTVRNYIGCAHAIRKSAALEMDGYAEELIHQGEERDLCIRLRDAGYRIVYGDTPPIVHLYSANRDRARVSYYGYRNTLLFNWMRVPFPYWIWRNVVNTIQLLAYRFDLSTLPLRLRAIAAGYLGVFRYWRLRQSVSARTYREFRSLPTHGPLSLDQLPPDERCRIEELMESYELNDVSNVST